MVILRTEEGQSQDIAGGTGSTSQDFKDFLEQSQGAGALTFTADTFNPELLAQQSVTGGGQPFVYRYFPGNAPLYGVNPATEGGVGAEGRWSGRGYISNTAQLGGTSSLDDYNAEFIAKAHDDPDFRKWVTQRAWAWGTNVISQDGTFNQNAAFSWWVTLGERVAMNPSIRDSMTPEEYADGIYMRMGGDEAFAQSPAGIMFESGTTDPPITTSTSTETAEYNPEEIEAGIDDLAKRLLGRMASDRELARYRQTIRNFIMNNPTIRTVTTDRTDPLNVKETSEVQAGATAASALGVLGSQIERGSEGSAYRAGKMLEEAMMLMDRGL